MSHYRTCSRCLTEKEISEFPFRNKVKGTRHAYCLECGRLWIRRHYQNNVDYYVKKARQRRATIAEELNTTIYDYLSTHPCVDCGETDPIVLEFDHVRGKKQCDISSMIYNMVSLNSVMNEISKCEVRCANCHRRKTAEQFGWYKYKKGLGR